MKYARFVCAGLVLTLLLGCLNACEKNPSPTEPSSTQTTQAVYSGYHGPKADYVYLHESGRNRDWEEDILYFANSYMTNHPMMRNRDFPVQYSGYRTEGRRYYSQDLCDEFVSEINRLIPEIADLNDDEILCRLQMITVLFHDIHTRLDYLPESSYSICFMPFYENETPQFYTVLIDESYENLLKSRLIAINDVPVEEIIERMRTFVVHENDVGLIRSMAYGGVGYEYLSNLMALRSIGVIGRTAARANFTLMSENGTETTIELRARTGLYFYSMVGVSGDMPYPIPFSNWERNYWLDTELSPGTLYLRISSFAVTADYLYMDLANELMALQNQGQTFDKIIVDLRFNGGGYEYLGYSSLYRTLSYFHADEFYVLMDEYTASCSMLFASELDNIIENVQFVGAPPGEAPGFLAGIYENSYVMPHCNIALTIPTCGYQPFPDNEENTFIPDILIRPTLEEYFACRDMVLEYLLQS